ncbi:hypothetical protein ACTHAM_002345 [Cellulomonas soli]|uniref:hypothetical protein n=1 Tax=Cellulomonas soli TaxID=931535 RepID=UPI003F83AB46
MEYLYESIPALDPVTGQLAPNSEGQVYAPTDVALANPLTVRGASGVPMTSIKAGPQGLIEVFRVDEHPKVLWVSGSLPPIVLTSLDGLQAAADAAAASAASSAAAAEEALSRSVRLGRPGAQVWTDWGTFTAANAPTVAEGAVAGDRGVMLQ